MKYFNKIFFSLIFLTILASCGNNTGNKDNVEIAILHTNDMHASIDNMAKLAAYKDEMKEKYDQVYLVSAGDIFSGNPVVDVYEEKGYPMIDLMNRVGYDITAIGNHEFDYGQETLSKRMKQAEFKFICANIDTKKTGLSQPKPYAVLKTHGRKLFFLSLIEIWNDGLPSTHPKKLEGLEFLEPEKTAQEFTHMKNKYNAFIGLTHLGYRADKRLAENFPEFDLIIGGHSHTLKEKAEKINNTLITQAGDDLNYIGKVVLSFNKDALTSIETEVIDLRKFNEEDEDIAALIKKYNDNEALKETIGIAQEPIQGKEELGALFTDAQVEMHNLDFSFQNNGGIRIPEIPKGEITVNTIYKLDPFGNELIKFEMKPGEIKSLLRHAYKRSGEPSLQIGGGSYTLFVYDQKELQKIEIRNEEGTLIHTDSTYTVGLNSYISSSYTFEHDDPGKSTYTTTAQNLIEFIRVKGEINYSGERRAFIEEIER